MSEPTFEAECEKWRKAMEFKLAAERRRRQADEWWLLRRIKAAFGKRGGDVERAEG